MEEHKLLTGMLLAALVVSIGGTLIAVDTMNSPTQAAFVTGAATGTGTGSATVSADISISVPDSAIDLGAGTVDPGTDFALVYSYSNDTVGGSWGNATMDNITVRNDGNTNINLTVQSTNASGNGSNGFACQGATCATEFGDQTGVQLNLLGVENEANACNGAGVNLLSQRVIGFPAAGTEYTACECLPSTDSADEVAFFMEVGIPDDAPAGSPSTTFTFTSYESDSGFC